MITKELFVDTINALKRHEEYNSKCTDAFQIILNEDRVVIGYDTSILTSQIIKLLEASMHDNSDWIEYFIYDLDFGKDYKEGCANYKDKTPIDLSSAEKLYDFLYMEIIDSNFKFKKDKK